MRINCQTVYNKNMKILSKILSKIGFSAKVEKSFFELSVKDKKRMIESAARQANDDQKQLMDRYHKLYGQGKA